MLKSFFERQVSEEGLGTEPPKNFVQPCTPPGQRVVRSTDAVRIGRGTVSEVSFLLWLTREAMMLRLGSGQVGKSLLGPTLGVDKLPKNDFLATSI